MRTIDWDDDRDCIVMVDQVKLPGEYVPYHATTISDLVESIQRLRVRGAPALGAAGAYGVALAARRIEADDLADFREQFAAEADRVATARPTAVNLERGVEEMLGVASRADTIEEIRTQTLVAAKDLADRDVERNKRIGANGASLLEQGQTVMTHCNAGALATVDWGTALGVIYSADEAGKTVDVIANETRPLNQGSRITTVELMERDVDVTLIPDNASGRCMQEGRVDAVIVGADRVVLSGGPNDEGAVFNKIGTYKQAVLANRHDIPFIVAAPRSTIDEHRTVEEIEIEERDPDELREIYGSPNAPADVPVYNPAFDPTPMHLVDHLVTEHGVFEPPFDERTVLQA